MDPIRWLFISVLLFIVAGLLSLLLRGAGRTARIVSGMLGMAASAAGGLAAVSAFVQGPASLELPGLPIFGQFAIELDSFSALMVGMISLLAFCTSLYSIAYLEEFDKRGVGELGFFNSLFVAAMLLVVSAANAFYFLIFWESMTLASYFLVIFEQEKKESVRAGYIYFLIAHIGTALIILAFLLFYGYAGSFDFAAFRAATLPPATKDIIFLLAFFGFGAKAGIVPLHIWLPRAHPAAPSHASALLSGVMIKTAVYGIIRLSVDLLGAPVWWWGFIVLLFGALSALLGILYALDERDLKRLLAYSSVENIGIILMATGTGMIGMAIGLPMLAVLGFLAALYHAVNHAVFKGLLFMGAGAVIHRTQTHNMNEMGGLARLMPWTGLMFLTGALAISAIPPLNGFVSEWFLYQSLFMGSTQDPGILRFLGPVFAMLLGLVGALAAMCFVKAYGTTFMGPPRSPSARWAGEVPGAMLAGMGILSVSAVLLGVGAPVVTPFLGGIAASLAKAPAQLLSRGILVFPGASAQAILSTPLVLALLAGLLTIPLLAVFLLGGFRAGQKSDAEPWACGYGYSPEMSVSAGNFAQPLRLAFQPLYGLRGWLQMPLNEIAAYFRKMNGGLPRAEPVVERAVSDPISSTSRFLGRQIQRLQMGDVRMYCLYIFLALAVLLIMIFR